MTAYRSDASIGGLREGSTPCYATGLFPADATSAPDKLLVLKREGVTLLVSEQNLGFTLELADRAYILERGAVRYAGGVDELKTREDVWHAYLAL
jgi:branched-chain amino acid transport system ATP-binding protein